MSRYIDADKAVRLLQGRLMETANNNCGFKCDAGSVFQDAGERIPRWIDEISTADVRENVHGRWIIKASSRFWSYERVCCSECGWSISRIIDTPARPTRKPYVRKRDDYNYCPNCGAQMVQGEEEQ